MALKRERHNLFNIVLFADDAVNCTREEYQKYLVTLDESILKLDKSIEPTRFVMKKHIDYEKLKEIEKEQYSINRGATEKDVSLQVNLSVKFEIVRCALTEIRNPDSMDESEKIKWVSEIDGYTSKNLISELHGFGAIDDLYNAYTYATRKNKDTELLKKK